MRRTICVAPLLAALLGLAAGAAAQQTAVSRASAVKKAKTAKTAKKKRLPKAPPVDPTAGDNPDGDDLTVRRAAVDALGDQAGSIVVVDPSNGRILTMVNQKLALQSGFTPCSTIKLVTSLAALTEHVVEKDTNLRLGRYMQFNMTTALAKSNNEYFAALGNKLGFERVVHYAQMLGLGEKAGLDVDGEQPGTITDAPPKWGGMGLMTSFGEGFSMTPLELAALLSSIANGGTLYYLQYPKSEAGIEAFSPQVKRTLEIAPNGIDDIKLGMRGAVEIGTARRANYDPNENIFGKTGTCTDFRAGSHMGWFGSFIESGKRQLVVVVMLTSPVKSVSGPLASGVAGAFYRNLSDQKYFASADISMKSEKSDLPEILVCCSHH
ncbi:MAG: penicillin-binding transpeptidase domain-containing protein [Bryobacteraceae bacterium]|jgi:penicillin-binding protein 2